LSGSGDKTLALLDVSSGKKIKTFKGHVGAVYAVAFSPDGKNIVSGGDDGTVRLWDVSTGNEVTRVMVFED